ncbi:MAG TPA: biopolymer transporter ExbD [Chthoniobacterales bacterium]
MNFRKTLVQQNPLLFNVTSLVDILMVLVVFLLMTWATTQVESDIGIQLPTAKSGEARNISPTQITVNIRPDNTLTVNQKTVDDTAFTDMLGKLAKLNPDQLVIVRADKTVSYERMLNVLDLCRQAGISDIGFGSVPEDKNK